MAVLRGDGAADRELLWPLGFDFAAPHLFGVLFSVQKGLFFWSPILLLAVAGLPLLPGSARAFLLPAAAVLAADTYVIASWWDWQFGGSYGHRGFIDLYPILALGLGAFFEWSARRRASQWAVAAVASLAVACPSSRCCSTGMGFCR